jgi:hypothetical protein
MPPCNFTHVQLWGIERQLKELNYDDRMSFIRAIHDDGCTYFDGLMQVVTSKKENTLNIINLWFIVIACLLIIFTAVNKMYPVDSKDISIYQA